MLRLGISEASAKVRTGPPVDDAEDLARPVWAGEIPLHLVAGPPVASPDLTDRGPVPAYATSYTLPAAGPPELTPPPDISASVSDRAGGP